MPLADKYRPTRIEDVVGQKHIIGRGRLLNNMIEKAYFPNMIFFGPPGVGKTTVAEIIAARADKKFFKINASNSSIDDIKRVIASIGNLDAQKGILLYIDEIQSFNKKQQQSIRIYREWPDKLDCKYNRKSLPLCLQGHPKQEYSHGVQVYFFRGYSQGT